MRVASASPSLHASTRTNVDAASAIGTSAIAATVPHVTVAAALDVVRAVRTTSVSGAAPATPTHAIQAASAVRKPMPNPYETTAKSRIHVAVDHGIVAAVRHGQPVADEPDVGQRLPSA